MSERYFTDLLEAQWIKGNFVCVGLDSDTERIKDSMVSFNREIVDQTKDIVCAYKLNLAYYMDPISEGLLALKYTVRYIHAVAPGIPIILDGKFADVLNTNKKFAQMVFDAYSFDVVTVKWSPGCRNLEPFLERKNKGIFVVCHMSGPGANEFQDAYVSIGKEEGEFLTHVGARVSFNRETAYATSLSNHVAYQVSHFWNKYGNCGVTCDAASPYIAEDMRKIVGDMPILFPAIGAQGGDAGHIMKAAKNSRGKGVIFSSSRSVIFASSPRDEVLGLNSIIARHA